MIQGKQSRLLACSTNPIAAAISSELAIAGLAESPMSLTQATVSHPELTCMIHASMTTTGIVTHWIERLNAGDSTARNELLRHAQHRLEILIRRMLRGFPNVHERTSDVLVGVMLRLDRAVQRL